MREATVKELIARLDNTEIKQELGKRFKLI